MPSEAQRRVLFVSYTGDWTGPTNSLSLLLAGLSQRYDVRVLCAGTGRFTELLTERGIPFYSLPKLDKNAIWPILRLLRQEQIDLVYGNSTHGSSRNALIAAKLLGIPFICHAREMGWDKDWRVLGFLRFTAATIAVSQACAASLERFVTPSQLHVIYNGVPAKDTLPDPQQARTYLLQAMGLQPEQQIVMSVAHIAERKGQHLIVEAFKTVCEQIPTARLLLVGSIEREAAYTERIRQLIADQGLVDKVHLTGFRADVFELLCGADLFVHAALKEPHPRAVLEAMQAGLPVVALQVDGVTETVLDGQTGYLVDIANLTQLSDKIMELLQDSELRQQMGATGSERVRSTFDAQVTAQGVADIIARCLH